MLTFIVFLNIRIYYDTLPAVKKNRIEFPGFSLGNTDHSASEGCFLRNRLMASQNGPSNRLIHIVSLTNKQQNLISGTGSKRIAAKYIAAIQYSKKNKAPLHFATTLRGRSLRSELNRPVSVLRTNFMKKNCCVCLYLYRIFLSACVLFNLIMFFRKLSLFFHHF